MRTIKFRAWDGKKMDYDPIQNTDGPEITGLNRNIEGMFEKWHTPQYIALQQFTGLKDKNGKEIYEGDIYHQGDKNILYKVIFKDCYFIGNQIGNESLAGLSHFIKDIEAIGNIFENPELIK